MADGKYIAVGPAGEKQEEQAIEETTGSSDASKVIRTDSVGLLDDSFLPKGFLRVVLRDGEEISYTRMVGNNLEVLTKE